jgi:transcriptional regulator with XRE-family HTH domain
MDYVRIGATIEHLRTTEPHIMSQQELANRAHRSAGYISEIISGERKPSLETYEAIAKVFNLKVADLLAMAGETVNPDLAWECDRLIRVVCRKGQLSLIEVQEVR